GDGTTTDRLTPVAVLGLSSGIVALAAGVYHTCALNSAGGMQCWGRNFEGELGDGTTAARFMPVYVSGLTSGVASITAGSYHTCAVTTGGAALCWGDNTRGQVGDNSTTKRLVPVPVSGLGSGVSSLAAGARHTCARTAGGGLQCWGRNVGGELGDG